MKVKEKLTVTFSVLTAGALLIISIIGYAYTSRLVEENLRREMEESVASGVHMFEGWLTGKIKILQITGQTVVTIPGSIENLDPLHLGGFKTVDSEMYSLWIGTAEGKMIDAKGWQPPPGYDVRQRPWYKAALSADNVVFSEPYEDIALERMVVAISMPLKDKSGTLLGVMAENLFIDTLIETVKKMEIRGGGYGFLLDQKGTVLAHPDKFMVMRNIRDIKAIKETENLHPENFEKEQGFITYNYQGVEKMLFYQKIPINGWILGTAIPADAFYQPLRELKVWFALSSIILIAVVIMVCFVVSKKITRPMISLSQIAKRFGSGDLKARASFQNSDDEIAQLANDFNRMAQSIADLMQQRDEALTELADSHDKLEMKVQIRTQNLLAANQELQAMNQEIADTMEKLKVMQRKMIQSEKMAALGALVGGMAHEINTPIGVGVTALSHLIKISEEFVKLAQGPIKRKELINYTEECKDIAKLVYENVKRASNLLGTIKHMAIDQMAETASWFCLKEFFNEMALSLQSALKAQNITVRIECEEGLYVYGFPGILMQIYSHLITNSLKHGYQGLSRGLITIKAERKSGDIELVYSDDGNGIDETVLPKIFDPFFTTARGSGGVGLGLYLVHTMVTQQLSGTVECRSEKGKGCIFTILLSQEGFTQ